MLVAYSVSYSLSLLFKFSNLFFFFKDLFLFLDQVFTRWYVAWNWFEPLSIAHNIIYIHIYIYIYIFEHGREVKCVARAWYFKKHWQSIWQTFNIQIMMKHNISKFTYFLSSWYQRAVTNFHSSKWTRVHARDTQGEIFNTSTSFFFNIYYLSVRI